MAGNEKPSLPASVNRHDSDDKGKVEEVFEGVAVVDGAGGSKQEAKNGDGTQHPGHNASEQPLATQRKTSLSGMASERHASTDSCEMPPPPHTRRRTTSTGLLNDLINSIEDESKEKGREYYEEEMEWLPQPEHPQRPAKRSSEHKKHPTVSEKISQIFNAVEDSGKQKGREYYEEENTWPLQ